LERLQRRTEAKKGKKKARNTQARKNSSLQLKDSSTSATKKKCQKRQGPESRSQKKNLAEEGKGKNGRKKKKEEGQPRHRPPPHLKTKNKALPVEGIRLNLTRANKTRFKKKGRKTGGGGKKTSGNSTSLSRGIRQGASPPRPERTRSKGLKCVGESRRRREEGTSPSRKKKRNNKSQASRLFPTGGDATKKVSFKKGKSAASCYNRRKKGRKKKEKEPRKRKHRKEIREYQTDAENLKEDLF